MTTLKLPFFTTLNVEFVFFEIFHFHNLSGILLLIVDWNQI